MDNVKCLLVDIDNVLISEVESSRENMSWFLLSRLRLIDFLVQISNCKMFGIYKSSTILRRSYQYVQDYAPSQSIPNISKELSYQ